MIKKFKKVLCPFHNDHVPSACLYPDGTFYCFVCSMKRKIEELPYELQKIFRENNVGAVEYQKKASIFGEKFEDVKIPEKAYGIPEYARDYFKRRTGVSVDSVNQYLSYPCYYTNDYGGRLVFEHRRDSNVLAVDCRSVHECAVKKSILTEGSTTKFAYGEFRFRKEDSFCILTEGIWDYLNICRCLEENDMHEWSVVYTYGLNFRGLLFKLDRERKSIIVAYDNDTAGEDAFSRIVRESYVLGLQVLRLLPVGNAKDFGDVYSASAFLESVKFMRSL